MMIPDYKLIATVILYSEGFENSKLLAQKMVQMYKLCSEQLSQQDQYDFGMRAIKSVLVMAGALKRASSRQSEDITMICALRDSNLPKFLRGNFIQRNSQRFVSWRGASSDRIWRASRNNRKLHDTSLGDEMHSTLWDDASSMGSDASWPGWQR